MRFMRLYMIFSKYFSQPFILGNKYIINQSIDQFIKIHTTNVHASVRKAQKWLHVFKQTIINKRFLI